MQESLVLFESVINSRWFLRTSVILFLNKIDVFKQKLPKVPLVHYFPEYTGGPDINKAAKYILWRFTQTNRARLSVYPHLTQATDTSNVSFWAPSRGNGSWGGGRGGHRQENAWLMVWYTSIDPS
jgi:guanine nucleotide-binding protein G(i) subunit alpha